MYSFKLLLINVCILFLLVETKKSKKKQDKEKKAKDYTELPEFKQIENYKEVITSLIPDFEVFLAEEENADELDFNDFLDIFQDAVDEIDQEVHEPTGNFHDSDILMNEWETKMVNFEPEFLLSFEVEQGQTEILYESISGATMIRGAFFIPMYTKENKIDFNIKTEKNEIVYSKQSVQEGLFALDLQSGGEYQFQFINRKSKKPQLVTFALDVHNSTSDHLQHHDLNPFEMKIDRIHSAMKDSYFETKFSQLRQEEGFQVLTSTHNKLLIFTFIETIGVILVNVWQVYYIKQILDNKRLI